MRRTNIREVRCRVTDRHTHRPTTVPSLRMRAEGNYISSIVQESRHSNCVWGRCSSSIALQYAPGVPENTKVWFWKLVHSLREEEKALLLKFSTGSPCVPVGGFKNLQVYIHIVAILPAYTYASPRV